MKGDAPGADGDDEPVHTAGPGSLRDTETLQGLRRFAAAGVALAEEELQGDVRRGQRVVPLPDREEPGGAGIRAVPHVCGTERRRFCSQGAGACVWAMAVPVHDPSGIVVAGLGVAVLSQGESSEAMLLKFLPRLRHGATRLGMLLK